MLLHALSGIFFVAAQAAALSVKELYRFPNETFIENLDFAPDGTILLTTFGEGRVYKFDPFEDNPEPRLVVEVPGLNAITGIAKVAPDTYAVSGAIREGGFSIVNGSCKIATFNINDNYKKAGAPQATILADVPSAGLLNGLVALPNKKHVILSAESVGGKIYRTDTSTGEVEVSFEHDLFRADPESENPVPLGINGIDIHKGYLYFTNSNRQLFGRVEINNDGDITGEIEEIYQLENSERAFDDFDISRRGEAYISLQSDSLVKITREGELITLVSPGGDVELLRPTANLLSKNEKTLFVVTAGEEDDERGQIIQVDL